MDKGNTSSDWCTVVDERFPLFSPVLMSTKNSTQSTLDQSSSRLESRAPKFRHERLIGWECAAGLAASYPVSAKASLLDTIPRILTTWAESDLVGALCFTWNSDFGAHFHPRASFMYRAHSTLDIAMRPSNPHPLGVHH